VFFFFGFSQTDKLCDHHFLRRTRCLAEELELKRGREVHGAAIPLSSSASRYYQLAGVKGWELSLNCVLVGEAAIIISSNIYQD